MLIIANDAFCLKIIPKVNRVGLALGEESFCGCFLEENSDKEMHKNKSVWQSCFLISLPDALIFFYVIGSSLNLNTVKERSTQVPFWCRR